MIPHLDWHENQSREIYSLEELDQLMNEVDHAGQEAKPFMITLQVSAETELGIVVGCEESHVNYYGPDQNVPVMGCTGPWDDETSVVYYYLGHYSEISRRFCVPIADAKEACGGIS